MKNLRLLRKAACLTQIRLAKKANVSRFRICMAEAGELDLRPDEMEAIRKAVAPELVRTKKIAEEFQHLP